MLQNRKVGKSYRRVYGLLGLMMGKTRKVIMVRRRKMDEDNVKDSAIYCEPTSLLQKQ